MGGDALEVLKLKIERADKHVLELHALIQAFLESGVYEVSTDTTVDSHEWLVIEQTKEIPGTISVVVGEIVYQLRSTLDHLACALARQNGSSDTSVYFPFAGDRQEFYLPATQRKIHKLGPDAIALIEELKPYKGGNDFLWSLSRIANIDRHRSNIAVDISGISLAAEMQVTLRAGENIFRFRKPFIPEIETGANSFFFSMRDPVRTTFQKKMPLMGLPIGAQGEGKTKITFDVTFGDVDIVGRHPVFTTMQQYFQLVRGICIAFDSRFFANAIGTQ